MLRSNYNHVLQSNIFQNLTKQLAIIQILICFLYKHYRICFWIVFRKEYSFCSIVALLPSITIKISIAVLNSIYISLTLRRLCSICFAIYFQPLFNPIFLCKNELFFPSFSFTLELTQNQHMMPLPALIIFNFLKEQVFIGLQDLNIPPSPPIHPQKLID